MSDSNSIETSSVLFCGQSRPLPTLIASQEHCMIKAEKSIFDKRCGDDVIVYLLFRDLFFSATAFQRKHVLR